MSRIPEKSDYFTSGRMLTADATLFWVSPNAFAIAASRFQPSHAPTGSPWRPLLSIHAIRSSGE